MYFQPWWLSRGKRSLTTTGLGGLRKLLSMLSYLRIRLISATYSEPSRNATPLGLFSPSPMVSTSGLPPSRGTMA